MNQTLTCFSRTALSAMFVLTMCQMVAAQTSQPIIRVYTLTNSDAEQVHEVISTMLQGNALRMTSDLRSNSLIVSCDKDVHEQVEELLKQLDNGDNIDHSDNLIEILNLSENDVGEIAQIVSEIHANHSSSDLRIAVNNDMGALIVSGTQADVDSVRKTVKLILDQAKTSRSKESAPANCIVRVTWLVDASHLPDAIENLVEPNSSLKEVVETLQRENYFKSIKVLTSSQTLVQLNEDSRTAPNEFSNVSAPMAFNQATTMHSQGTVRETGSGQFAVEISLELESQVTVPIKTSIVVPKNHPVAFSISDVGMFRSAVVVEIISAD